ncbi:heat shock protein DnaJ, partial [Zopfia rhizophila CBS 207.26]
MKGSYYDFFKISRTASLDEINKAYKKMALEVHPDKHPGNEEEMTEHFKEVQAVYDVLRDPDKRTVYD